MKNNDECKAFVRNELNWKPIELTTFTVTKLMRYKGDEWLKVSIITETEKWWDEDLHTHSRRIVKELDKMYPDKKEGLSPNHLDIDRPGSRFWPFKVPEKKEEEE